MMKTTMIGGLALSMCANIQYVLQAVKLIEN